jgi:UDP-glucose 4-epimerase
VVAIFSNRLLDGQAPTIFDDGEQTRDYVYVADVAAANVAAVELDLSGCGDPVFNISTGRETTVNALFDEMSQAFGSDLRPVYGPPRPGDVRRSLLDASRAREILGFVAQTDLRTGLQLTAEYFSARARAR